MNLTRINNLMVVLALVAMLGGLSSCKAKKEAKAAEAARLELIEKTKSQLTQLIDDKTLSLEEKEAALAAIKGRNIDDPEVKALIEKLEGILAEERAIQEKAEAKKKKLQEREEIRGKLSSGFSSIASAGNLNLADQKISDLKKYFDTAETTVLIIISKEGERKDYDRPTTIDRYLNFLKDRKAYKEKIVNVEFDEKSNKIKLLELSRIQ